MCVVFFFNDTATTEIYTLSLHDALPILVVEALRPGAVVSDVVGRPAGAELGAARGEFADEVVQVPVARVAARFGRSEEHTSELQSRQYLVCRLLLEKKKAKETGRLHRFA